MVFDANFFNGSQPRIMLAIVIILQFHYRRIGQNVVFAEPNSFSSSFGKLPLNVGNGIIGVRGKVPDPDLIVFLHIGQMDYYRPRAATTIAEFTGKYSIVRKAAQAFFAKMEMFLRKPVFLNVQKVTVPLLLLEKIIQSNIGLIQALDISVQRPIPPWVFHNN